jgi:uncharacterized protein (DUF1800 family)
LAASADDIAHLLRRTEFVVKPARMTELAGLADIGACVDNVLDFTPNANPQLPAYLQTLDEEDGWGQYVYAYNWWVDSMLSRPRALQEKMTLFWHGHFVSSLWDGVDRVDHMTEQNQLFRSLAAGDFLSLTQQMAVQPAMLLYLSGANNVKGAPNENFARELMELFTLGVGNYTQDDVAAAARAWTGHNYIWELGTYVFRANKHDNANKTFFGVTKNWNGPDIINEILRDNAAKRLVAAKIIARKLWEFFAYPAPAQGIVDDLATTFIANNLNVAELLRALFKRSEFYSVAAKQGLVRTPIEYVLELMLRTGLTSDDLGLSWRSDGMGQALYSPPNVAGWKSNAYWLNTSSLSARMSLARDITWHLRSDGGFDELYDRTPAQAVDDVAAFFGLTLSTVTRNALISAHQAERASVAWDNWWAPTNLLTMVMTTPEMNMA